MWRKTMTAIGTADTLDKKSPSSLSSASIAPGWWILPSIFGGLYIWYRIILFLFG
jgi:hypothetical protein